AAGLTGTGRLALARRAAARGPVVLADPVLEASRAGALTLAVGLAGARSGGPLGPGAGPVVGAGALAAGHAVEVVAPVDRLGRGGLEHRRRGGDGGDLDGLAAAQLALHLADVLLLLRGDEGDDRARLAGPAGATGAVDVVLVGGGRVELQHAGHS